MPRSVSDKVLGHSLMVAAAVAFGYGFFVHEKIAYVVALVCWWIADDKLTPFVKKQVKNTEDQLPKVLGALTPAEQKLLNSLLVNSKDNPPQRTFEGGKVILDRLRKTMECEHQLHIESLLCALGALAGYACQASLRNILRDKGLAEKDALTLIETTNGSKYYFGNSLNYQLAESSVSVWSLASARVKEIGGQHLPNINEMFAHVTDRMGHANYGIPRVSEKHMPQAAPIDMLKTYWPTLAPVARKFCLTHEELPLLFAMAIRQALLLSKGRFAPEVALTIVMESAISMSKIDFGIS